MKPREPEKLLGVRDVAKILGSYCRRDILRMLDSGELRALWQMRGNRRHWSIPASAVTEFIDRLHSNQDEFGRGLDPLAMHPLSQPLRGQAAPLFSPAEQQDRRRGAAIHSGNDRTNLDQSPRIKTENRAAACAAPRLFERSER